MKNYLMILFFIILFSVSASFGDVIYVSSMKTDLYSEAKRNSDKIGELTRGAELTVLSKEGAWIHVKYNDKEGYVSKIVTSSKKPGEKMSLLASADQNTRIHARQRASSDVTAASARGLFDESGKSGSARARAVDSASGASNKEVISKMERLSISEEALIAFLKEEEIQ